MADIEIKDTTGGLSTRPPTALLPTQVHAAQNVEWFTTRCGERRGGLSPVTVDEDLEDVDTILWLHRHLPTNDEEDAQLWVFGMEDTTPVLKYKDTTWHTVTMPDAIDTDENGQFRIHAVSLHGKLFIAYDSDEDRLHVWVPGASALRRAGMDAPAAPTAADTGAGAIEDTRTYRVRFTEQDGDGITIRRSEPSAELAYDPTVASGVTVTQPAGISEGETHWELEAKKSDGIWYRIETIVIATTTYNDTIADGVSYSTIAEDISEELGEYTLIPSVRYLSTIDDRLIWAGSFEDAELDSQVGWSAINLAAGVGNDERMPVTSVVNSTVPLNSMAGGPVTGISPEIDGYIYVTKHTHIYQGMRNRNRLRAYEFILLTDQRGAVAGTLVSALDSDGNAILMAIDRTVGPIRLGGTLSGVQTCGNDLINLWRSIGIWFTPGTFGSAQMGAFYQKKKQVIWVNPYNNFILVAHTQFMRNTEDDGFRGGWSVWIHGCTGRNVNCITMFSDNIEDDDDRSINLVPFYGMGGIAPANMLFQGDTGHLDDDNEFYAFITTQEKAPTNFVHDFEVKELTMYGESDDNFDVAITLTGKRANKTSISTEEREIDFSGVNADFYYEHGNAVKRLDNVGISELQTIRMTYGDKRVDGVSVAEGWGINLIVLTLSPGRKRS